MRIVLVDTTLTTHPTGGAHTFTVALARELVRSGWFVTVVTQPGDDQSLCTTLDKVGARVVLNLWRGWHLAEERAERLARWVRSVRPDVYVISTSPDAGWLALPHLPRTLPTMCISHTDAGAYYEPLKHYGPFIDCAVGVSAEVSRNLTEVAGMSAARVRHIPYGVDGLTEAEASHPRRPGPLRIGYVGRVVQDQKRVLDLLPLARQLAKRGIAFELDIVGDGSERPRLEEAFRSEGLTGPVRFWGWLVGAEISTRYRALDVFLLTSDCEGLPVALLEAVSHAVVPVVTRISSGNTEVVRDGENGYLIPVGDVCGFADRLQALANDLELLARLRHAAWQTSRAYRTERMIEQYVSCFTELTASHFDRRHRPAVTDYPVMPSCRSRYPFWMRKIKWSLASVGKSVLDHAQRR